MPRRPKPTPLKLRIAQLDRLLAANSDALDVLAERAGLLRELGRFEEAKRDYLELIRLQPTDFRALNDFGTLVLKAGYKDAARSLFSEAVRHHPDNPMGRVNLATLLFLLGELDQAREHFEAALRRPDPSTSIAAWAICWPKPATRPAHAGIARRDFGPAF